VPTLIQESGGRPVEEKRAELAALPDNKLSDEDVAAIRAIGDNAGCMALKGGSPEYEGDALPDRWALDDGLVAVAARWDIHPGEQLVQTHQGVL
jgi:hypothetical protein